MTEQTLQLLRGFRCLLLALVASGASLSATAEPCDPEQAEWMPSHSYPAGEVVFHKDKWYESREIHQGKEPGITFDWIELDSVPECDATAKNQDESAAESAENTSGAEADGASKTRPGENSAGLCKRPDQWLFGTSYNVGEEASHGGKIWEAIRTTKGDMPGMNEPPAWKLVENHCAMQPQ